MNLKRVTIGFLLSLVFLFIFLYIISGTQFFFEDFLQIQSKNIQASILNGFDSANLSSVSDSIVQSLVRPEINAEAVISVESNLSGVDKVIFEKDSSAKLPIASLTKLMTAIVVLDNYDLSKNITVDNTADSQDSLQQDVKFGDTMPVESFLEIMLVESSNKSAYALSELMGEPEFVALMNKKAKELGLFNTFFDDPTGLSSKNISTSSDLSKLAEYILKNYPKIVDISRTKELNVPNFGKIINTDQLLGEIPEAVCSKTGFTTDAKGCLLLVVYNSKNNNYLINVILGADDRFSEMRKLINWSSAVCN